MLQIAKGMEYLHSDRLRIIHRDLKSSNILVSFSNRARISSSYVNDTSPHVHLKIADFGMSKAKYASSRYTTRPAGTISWRAPEVFEGNPEDEMDYNHPNLKYTNKADVYSFGLVFCYEILTGKFPFEGTQIQRRVLTGERPTLPSYCPPALSSYIKKCWHPEPAERPTFTQICRMLRYFKACILLQNHDQDHNAIEDHNWLLHSLSTTMCTHIDDMLQSLVQQFSPILQPQLLIIPLEMYCCRVVLQQFRAGLENQRSSVGIEESRRKTKHYLNGTSNWLKMVFCMKGTENVNSSDRQYATNSSDRQYATNSELRDRLGLVGNFTYEELREATNNFSSVIGCSRSGKVYLGMLVDGRRVAVKVDHAHGREASPQILIQALTIAIQHWHSNIVPLFGWCQSGGNLLLVYEYMPNGDLEKHIFQEESVFGWHQRYKVVCQVAAALKYLHQDSGYMQIVHGDVKTSSILLDSQWNARLGVCGLALTITVEGTLHFTAPKNDFSEYDVLLGTTGCIAPEALLDRTVSPASDIFSFGVTVLEIATGRRAYNHVSADHKYLVDWVWELYQEGEVLQASDVRLAGNFDKLEMERLLVLGLVCTNVDPQARPSMEKVLRILSTATEPPAPEAPRPYRADTFSSTREPLSPPPTRGKRVCNDSQSSIELWHTVFSCDWKMMETGGALSPPSTRGKRVCNDSESSRLRFYVSCQQAELYLVLAQFQRG